MKRTEQQIMWIIIPGQRLDEQRDINTARFNASRDSNGGELEKQGWMDGRTERRRLAAGFCTNICINDSDG